MTTEQNLIVRIALVNLKPK